jgi:hypothetical protein
MGLVVTEVTRAVPKLVNVLNMEVGTLFTFHGWDPNDNIKPSLHIRTGGKGYTCLTTGRTETIDGSHPNKGWKLKVNKCSVEVVT